MIDGVFVGLELDTQKVIDGQYDARTIADGLIGVETPIFDRLAADRFGREAE